MQSEPTKNIAAPAHSGGNSPWYWTLLLVAATAMLIFIQPFTRLSAHSSEPLSLRSTDVNGRMRVEWDPRQAAVRDAQGATLEVIDGNLTNRYPVDPRVLRSGSFDYLRQSDDVLLTMTLHKDGTPGVEGIIRSVGKPAASPAAAASESSRARAESRPWHKSRKRGSRH